MSDIAFTCSHCGQHVSIDETARGQRVACPTCQGDIAVPKVAAPPPLPSYPVSPRHPRSTTNKKGSIPTGAAGLALTVIFLIAIIVAPGGFYSVMLGGFVGLAGLVISIIGIATGSGRIAGVFGILVFILGWVINTLVIGRL